MPWLPLAILLIAALTIAALALILFPPGEVREQAVEDDIIDDAGEESDEDDLADDEDNLSPPSHPLRRVPDGDPPLRGEDKDSPVAPPTAGPERQPS
jgi:hypothetical protein